MNRNQTQAPVPNRQTVKKWRVYFVRADRQYLYVTGSRGNVEASVMRVRYNVPGINAEFAATCSLLWPHACLNLLDVEISSAGILTPHFIILEPDYLIDISSLAECFKEYGHHPAGYLLGRLQMQSLTRQMLLGNIVNLFLDEWIYAADCPDYRKSLRKAFRQYAVELTACPDLANPRLEAEFFADLRQHFEHLRTVVTAELPASGLDRRDAVLEPTYVCEALGLQGRLDYMQRDMTALIEMKSGRADEYTRRGHILPRENNLVQMQLYRAVLEYSMGMNRQEINSFLLYTRYPALYHAPLDEALLRTVMDVRGRIVAGDYELCRQRTDSYTARCLASINPLTLGERGQESPLWKRYQAPAIEAFAERMQSLTPLEKSYFQSLYLFITTELLTAKTGCTDGGRPIGTSALWNLDNAAKEEEGEIITDLHLTDNRADDLLHPTLHFATTPSAQRFDVSSVRELAAPNFRTGDAVLLYAQTATDSPLTGHLLFRAGIEQIRTDEVVLRLRAPQRNKAVLPPHGHYTIEHDSLMDTAFRSMYQGLGAFLQANADRRDLLLSVRSPRRTTRLDEAIRATADPFERISLKAEAALDYFLLVGPPGSGKTSRALRAMVERFLKNGQKLLLLAYTNRAVDEICKMLSTITPAVDFIRVANPLSTDAANRSHLIDEVLKPCANRDEVRKRLEACPIFAGTVSTLSARTDLFRLCTFDVALIDEASQILEPQLLTLLCLKSTQPEQNAIKKFVLIGDHKQLPAVVMQAPDESRVTNPALNAIGLTNLTDSLFERLYRRLSTYNATLKEDLTDMLCRQGRMHPAVASFASDTFYGGLLQSAGLAHQTEELPPLPPHLATLPYASLLTRRVSFIPSQPEPSGRACKSNRSEAHIVAELTRSIYRYYESQGQFDPQRTLGIITPFRSQIALIRHELEALNIEQTEHITIDTVERYQGSERDVIIYSFAISRNDELTTLASNTLDEGVVIDRKLNVALTRARKQMFITGVTEILEQNPIYRALINRYRT